MSLAWDTMVMPAWVWRNPKVKPGAMRDVLVCLLWHQGQNAAAWPTVAKMAAELGYGVTAVRDAIRQLETVGVVVVERRQALGLPSLYRVVPLALARATEPDAETCPEGTESRDNLHRNPVEGSPDSGGGGHRIPVEGSPDSDGQKEPFQRTLPVEPDQGTDVARAHASEASPMTTARTPVPARGSVDASVWSAARLRVLLMEAVARVIGTQPTIEGAQKLRVEAYFERTTREVAERDLEAFEGWLRLQASTRARSMRHGFEFGDQTPGTWPDRLAEALGKRRGPAKPGSIEEFDRAHEALGRDGWVWGAAPTGGTPATGKRRRSIPRQEVHAESVYAREAASTPSIEEQLAAAAKRAAGGSR